MKNIDGGIVRHDLLHAGESIEQKVEELLRCHIVVFDLPGGAFVVHVVRRVSHHKVCLPTVHEDFVGFQLGAVTADETMSAERPHITHLAEGGLLQSGIDIEVIVFCFLAVIKELRQLLFIKAGEERVEVHALEFFDLNAEKLLVPSGIKCHAVVGDNVCFLLRFGEVVGKHTGNLGDAFLTGSKNTTMTGDYAEITVDNYRIDEAELTERGTELIYLLR